MTRPTYFLVLVIGLYWSAWAAEIHAPVNVPQAEFAAQKLREAAPPAKIPNLKMRIDPMLPEQGYAIRPANGGLTVIGGDARGLMYGGLELAERLRFGEDVSVLSIENQPFIKRRGLKMNIPLDARSPSYDDSGTSARMNIEQVWSEDFWHGFLDRMAEHRYNTLTLWCNHPFAAMLQLEDYPDVALDDVAVPTYKIDDQMLPQYMQADLQTPENYEIIKTMPMADKVEFWRHVMRYAKERGIDIYFITWNIWVHGAEGKYGIGHSQTNEATIAYMRESVKQFVLTYPDLKGIGITCGEHMQNKLEGQNAVEKWMWKTYGQGIVDAKAEQPGREVEFIHRTWYSGMDVMMDDFISKYPDPISLGFKYAKARLYSIPNPPFFKEQLQADCEKYNLSCWMNLRNDDIFSFRWGDPDYVREYMRNLPPEPLLAGYHMGSDGYVWGREFTSIEPDSPRQLEIDKHWYKFMLWGRLGFDPALDRAFFEKQLANRFPMVGSEPLYDTWQTASKIVPLVNTWHWRDWDHMWSVEICASKKEGYHTVNHFIEFAPLPEQGMQSIDAFVRRPNPELKSPLAVANELDQLAAQTLAGLSVLKSGASSPPNKELRQTYGDLEAFARLGQYYADKIRGATALHRFRVEGEKKIRREAVKHLKVASGHWKQYAGVASSQYNEQLFARTSYTDRDGRLLELAIDDIRIAKEAKHNEFPPSALAWKNKK
ncbi:beta-N-acetylhexosaminidase family protein [Pontiella sulfatireligans]|uniref:Alpha glucuronidase N-terminal domain-containing protein n=1 Tax=Pontiella sulfatireligans TaxID=2750658 RepID=A0A6C2UTD0_9BACT|nr:hypothetical protein [Pontiella sulfatireligans]VGO22467.1 hypothetical protein SCARR_04550 [Pontiella sulfatireligans]